ncbi:MAG: carbohydrate ABC transporter permease [Trueperaceae bacterium]|nr:MAG: carbohydrate ABC transporter permease [Trueperaceae bacterium]
MRQLLLYAIALAAILVPAFPIVWVLNISLHSQREAFSLPPNLQAPIIFDHYRSVWADESFRESFTNTVIVTAIGVALAMAIAVPSAYGLNRFRFRGKPLFGIWLLLAYMLPEFLFAIPIYILYQKTGLYDTHFGLALIYQVHSLPFAIWLVRSFFKEVSAELDDAARIDGCTHLGTLRYVYIPVSTPGLAATAILTAIWIWNELTIALALTFTKAQTITVGVASFRGYTAMKWGETAAASIIAIIPMLLFALIAQRYIVKGLTLGSVKG